MITPLEERLEIINRLAKENGIEYIHFARIDKWTEEEFQKQVERFESGEMSELINSITKKKSRSL